MWALSIQTTMVVSIVGCYQAKKHTRMFRDISCGYMWTVIAAGPVAIYVYCGQAASRPTIIIFAFGSFSPHIYIASKSQQLKTLFLLNDFWHLAMHQQASLWRTNS